jgi:molecular chaperone GrpE
MTEHKKKNRMNDQDKPLPEGDHTIPEGTPEGEPKGESESENQPQPTMVALSLEEYDAFQKQIEDAKAKEKEYLDSWQRERADFMNYKKRIERESESAHASAVADVVQKYLVLQDDLERALKSRPEELAGSTWVEGIEFIYRKLLSLLEKEGIKQIIPTDEMFDPTIHEAVAQEDNSDRESGQIIEVISPGYQMGDRVIRPARVRVAR